MILENFGWSVDPDYIMFYVRIEVLMMVRVVHHIILAHKFFIFLPAADRYIHICFVFWYLSMCAMVLIFNVIILK